MEGYDPRSPRQKAEDEERRKLGALQTRLSRLYLGSLDPVKYPPPAPHARFHDIPVFFEDIIRPNAIPEENNWPQGIYMRYFPIAPMLIQPVSVGLIDKHYHRLPTIANTGYIVAPTLRFRNVKEATEQKLKIVRNIAEICDANPVKTILIIFYRTVDAADSTITTYATTHLTPLLKSPPSMEASPSAAAVDERTFEEMIANAIAAEEAATAAAPKAEGGGGGPSIARAGGGGPPMKKSRKTHRRRRNTRRNRH